MTGRRHGFILDDEVSVEDALDTLAQHDYEIRLRCERGRAIASVTVGGCVGHGNASTPRRAIIRAILQLQEDLQ